MNTRSIFLLFIIIITSYIIIFNSKKILLLKESFENSQEILKRLSDKVKNAELDGTSTETDSQGNIIPVFKKIDTDQVYQNLLQADDIKIGTPKTVPEFEILDQIVKQDDNIFRSVQFENNERELLPKPIENIDYKSKYNTNFIETPMQEKSLNLNLEKYKHNGTIDIDDPINDAYLPYYENKIMREIKPIEQNNIEYQIISLYKEVLDRNPTASELLKHTQSFLNNEIDINLLRVNIINSTEYKRNIKLQSNEVFEDIQYGVAKEDLILHITKLYFNELEHEVPRVMLMPLKDVWIYLQGNEFLFRAFLIHNNYPKFENDVMNTNLLSKSELSKLINKYYILYDLKIKANDIQKSYVLENRGIKNTLSTVQNENLFPIDNKNNNTTQNMIDLINDEYHKLEIKDKIKYNAIKGIDILKNSKNNMIKSMEKVNALI